MGHERVRTVDARGSGNTSVDVDSTGSRRQMVRIVPAPTECVDESYPSAAGASGFVGRVRGRTAQPARRRRLSADARSDLRTHHRENLSRRASRLTDRWIVFVIVNVAQSLAGTGCDSKTGDVCELEGPGETMSRGVPALDHGRLQLLAAMRDRQALCGVGDWWVSDDAPVSGYAARLLNGEGTGFKIFWNNDPLRCDPARGDPWSTASCGEKEADCIRLCSAQADWDGFERSWSGLIFELYNLENCWEFIGVNRRAHAIKMSREEWIETNANLEFEAEVKVKRFYLWIWLPWAEAEGIPTSARSADYWHVNSPSTYKEWKSIHPGRTGWPWNYWGRVYDEEFGRPR